MSLHFRVDRLGVGALPYELRLEMDGALKSWAVHDALDEQPCATSRLAVAGKGDTLDVGEEAWDEGTWIPEGEPVASYRRGKLDFELKGRRLTGRWQLMRTGNAQTRKKGLWVLKKLEQ
jgi:bifunctional non-homologous end joining protein LigD